MRVPNNASVTRMPAMRSHRKMALRHNSLRIKLQCHSYLPSNHRLQPSGGSGRSRTHALYVTVNDVKLHYVEAGTNALPVGAVAWYSDACLLVA